MKIDVNGSPLPYELTEIVYLRTDESNRRRILTGTTIRCNGSVQYEVSFGTEVSWHYEAEISREVNGLPPKEKTNVGFNN